MWRIALPLFIVASAFGGSTSFPSESTSAKWIDRLDAWFAKDADATLAHLRATEPEIKKYTPEQMKNAKAN